MEVFERQITVTGQKAANNIEIVARMKDNAHEIAVELLIDSGTMKIIGVKGEMLRIPYEVCRQALDHLKGLQGFKIEPGINRRAQQLLGGTLGCVHLLDLLRESFKGAVQVKIRLSLNGLAKDKRIEALEDMFQDSCLRYKRKEEIS